MRTGDSGILVTPSGVLKESVREEDIFTLDDAGQVLEGPDNSQLKFSSFFPNFQHIYRLRYGGGGGGVNYKPVFYITC